MLYNLTVTPSVKEPAGGDGEEIEMGFGGGAEAEGRKLDKFQHTQEFKFVSDPQPPKRISARCAKNFDEQKVNVSLTDFFPIF